MGHTCCLQNVIFVVGRGSPTVALRPFCILRGALGFAQHLVAATRKRDSHHVGHAAQLARPNGPNGAHPSPRGAASAPRPPSTVRRRWSAGCRATPRRSSAGGGVAGPRSARSSRWSPTRPTSAASVSIPPAAAYTTWRSARSISRSTPAAAPTTGSTASAPASILKACWRGCGSAACAPLRRRSGPDRRGSSCSCRAPAIRSRGCSGPRIRATVDRRAGGAGPIPGCRRLLADASPDRIDALLHVARGCRSAGAAAASRVTPSRTWLADARRRAARAEARARFEAEVAAGAQTIDLLHHPLLPYQREGMLHLAFGERALLADDMGLGKTIQAIAAARAAAPAATASRACWSSARRR